MDPLPVQYDEKVIMRQLIMAAVVGTLLLTVATPAMADASGIPDDVTTWFTESAASNVSDSSTVAGTTGLVMPQSARISVGEPQAVLRASADGGLVETGEWTAPLLADGVIVGTVTAWRSPTTGLVELAFYDNSVAAGEGIAEAAESRSEIVLIDPLGSGRLILDSDTQRVEPLELAGMRPLQLGDYLDKVAESVEKAKSLPSTDTVGGSPGVFTSDDGAPRWSAATLLGLLLAGVGGVVLWSTRRHAPPADGKAG